MCSSGASLSSRAVCTTTARRLRAYCRCISAWCRMISVRRWWKPWCANIVQKSDGHVGTGLVGAQWLMRTLSDNGQADLAFKIATQKTYPGWADMVDQGATTVWELWHGNTAAPASTAGQHAMATGRRPGAGAGS